jgi:hypothetical protein
MNPAPPAGRRDTAIRFILATVWILAIIQGVLLVTQAIVPIRLAGFAAAMGSTAIALRRTTRGRTPGLVAAAAVAFTAFCLHIHASPGPFTPRLLYVLVGYGYATLGLAAAASLVLRDGTGRLFLSAVALTSALVVAEASLEYIDTPAGEAADAGPTWVGGTARHPVLGDYYTPNSVSRTIYPTNPRGYFKATDPREAAWQLRLHHPGSQARLRFPSQPSSGVRVDIDQADVPTPWHVQVTLGRLVLRRGERYLGTFRARADRPRAISYGVSQAHPPWEGLGWYRRKQIGASWQEYREEFEARQSDDQARITFDLGESPVAVEVSEVEIRHVESGEHALKEVPAQSYVEYRFNSQGCRGPEYPIPAPAHRRRILALGDSFTLGVGVHEEHTFSRRLEHLLNADAEARQLDVRYDVVNCGVSGYSTREERLIFELLTPIYRPQIIVLAMVFNDNRSWRSEVEQGYVHNETKYERLFLIWNAIQDRRSEWRTAPLDFSGSVREVLLLRDLVARAGARLVVVAFRHVPMDEQWRALIQSLARGLTGSDVPWLDLGDRILADHRAEDLVVHEIDQHPNELAHEAAAIEIAELLRRRGMLE